MWVEVVQEKTKIKNLFRTEFRWNMVRRSDFDTFQA